MEAAVFFDVGETLVNESRLYEEWSDYLGVPRLTFLSALGAVIERRQHHGELFRLFAPDLSLADLFGKREREDRAQILTTADLYPDAVSCIESVQEAGYMVGVVGNQPASVQRFLAESFPSVDLLATSEGWGVEKPSREFFKRVVEVAGLPPNRIAYVGDRIDNDIVPAADAGMVAVFIRRGPWGVIQSEWAEASRASIRIDSLDELPAALAPILPPSG
jgi:HAD superfamily hydrolase (TIGR01549 family)